MTPGLKVRYCSPASFAEGVEDARRLVHRAVARPFAEDAAAVRLTTGGAEDPAGGAATADGAGALDATLEREGDVGALGGVDQRRARDRHRIARILLVAREDYYNLSVVQCPRLVQRAQRVDDDDVAALHVRRAGSARAGILAHEALVLPLEDGVEVSDEEHALPQSSRAARRPTLGDEMTCASHRRRQLRPAHGEADRLELALEDVAHRAHAGDVERAARDVDGLLEQPDRAVAVGAGTLDDLALGAGERLRRHRRGHGGERGGESGEELSAHRDRHEESG